jgi:hypothetical protein
MKIMAKAILEFNLPEDNQEFQLATKGIKFWDVLWNFDQYLREKTKYQSDNMSQETYDALQDSREKLRELMAENLVSLDMVE